MKKNYIEPSMMVVTLNANTILAGSITPGENGLNNGTVSGDDALSKETEYSFDLADED